MTEYCPMNTQCEQPTSLSVDISVECGKTPDHPRYNSYLTCLAPYVRQGLNRTCC